MTLEELIRLFGLVAGIAMPFFNIPLILKIRSRGSSADISIVWTMGVWICVLLMTPAALSSADFVFRMFGIVNLVLFSGVVLTVLKYRRRSR